MAITHESSGGWYGTGVSSPIESLSAITLITGDMTASVAFYRALGFEVLYGGEEAAFTSFAAGSGYLNVIASTKGRPDFWGRAIFYVEDVDAMHARAVAAGYTPQAAPRDAEWGERYFHINDPDGHELSFARPLRR